MATTKFKANPDVYDLMRSQIANHFPELALVDQKIAIIFREKASNRGGVPVLGYSYRAPDILDVLGDGEYEFVIEFAHDQWVNLTDLQREALMYHHLCSLSVQEDEETHEIQCKILPPDVVAYAQEIDKYGAWRPKHDPEAETAPHDAAAASALLN